MNTDNKIKVVWICHFSNQKLRNHLPLSGRKVRNWVRALFGKPQKKYVDYAPWNNLLIDEFEKIKNVELHVIAPHAGLKKAKYNFEINGIHYHFFRDETQSLSYIAYRKLKREKDYQYKKTRKIVKGCIKEIQPDIINLIGAENPKYAITDLDIHDIPVFVTCQTVYSNPTRRNYSTVNETIWDIEKQIHEKEHYFGCQGRMHRDLLLNNNPEAIVFKYLFPYSKPLPTPNIEKKYDFAFWAAGVVPKKGIEEAIDALAIVKKEKADVTLTVAGRCEQEYKKLLDEKIEALGLQGNISFVGYFAKHSDMLRHIEHAKYALLPIKLDVISSTIIEACQLGIPVVTCRTTGTPLLNRDKEGALISEIGDVEELANNMLKYMDNPDYAQELAINAKEIVSTTYDNTTSAKRLVADYHAVIEHYRHGTPIPQELLFDINEFPKY